MAACRVAGLHEYCFSQGENGLFSTSVILKKANKKQFDSFLKDKFEFLHYDFDSYYFF